MAIFQGTAVKLFTLYMWRLTSYRYVHMHMFALANVSRLTYTDATLSDLSYHRSATAACLTLGRIFTASFL